MADTSNFNETKALLTSYLQSIDLDNSLINQMLTDEFINGLLELDQQKPQNNEFLSLLQNFSHEQSLAKLNQFEKALVDEMSRDGYVNRGFRFFREE